MFQFVLNKVKDIYLYCFKNQIIIHNYKMSYRNSSLLHGFIGYLLLFIGSINILHDTFVSIISILYAFLIMLPISYIHRKESEK